jgi:hypothetical protein
MVNAADDGVQLVPLSGFRSREAQSYVFYAIADQRGQTLQQRARYAAPPATANIIPAMRSILEMHLHPPMTCGLALKIPPPITG